MEEGTLTHHEPGYNEVVQDPVYNEDAHNPDKDQIVRVTL